ncbi:2-amino-4-hydroxy-6-hydroxymethyldihydropteridine diphosphokinase [Botrimarina sp.]|uniref:2-amino-4-hydroxy-6- hydroxymethyldihydropteridine diphosphokinase n=1 Tax=Botrimarina sp. TaxID=2795802 RepID=UPI0032EEA6FB
MARCLVSLGSNHGDSDAAIGAAAEALDLLAGGDSLTLSATIVTPPVGGPAGQRAYLNAAAALTLDLPPAELLRELQRIEARHDRRRSVRWDARTLDLDLLLYDDRVVRTSELRLPHPRMTFRRFVLDPARQVAGEWVHPECERTLDELLRLLDAGTDAVHVADDDDGAASDLVRRLRPDATLLRQPPPADAPPPRLTIACSADPWPLGPCGPRLALADCPREHWEAEVAAALRCVWPA